MLKTMKEYPLYLKSIIVSNLIYYVFLIPAALIYPGYSPITHTVSSLGNTAKSPAWFLFSICLILLAFTLLPFIWETKRWAVGHPSVDKYVNLIIIVGFFNSIALILIAINPTNLQSQAHNFWSLVNFICIEIVIILAVIALRNHPAYDNRISIIAIVDFVCCAVYLYLLPRVEWAKIFEWLTFILILSYLLILGFQMYKTNL